MHHLFIASTKYVIIYSSNYEGTKSYHIRNRCFTEWVNKNIKHFILIKIIKNRYPYDIENPLYTSFADFYIYKFEPIQ
jgi:hypothetical protein